MKALIPKITILKNLCRLEFYLSGSPLTVVQALDIFEELSSRDTKHHWGYLVEHPSVQVFCLPFKFTLTLLSANIIEYPVQNLKAILTWMPRTVVQSFTARSHDIPVVIVSDDGQEITTPLYSLLQGTV